MARYQYYMTKVACQAGSHIGGPESGTVTTVTVARLRSSRRLQIRVGLGAGVHRQRRTGPSRRRFPVAEAVRRSPPAARACWRHRRRSRWPQRGLWCPGQSAPPRCAPAGPAGYGAAAFPRRSAPQHAPFRPARVPYGPDPFGPVTAPERAPARIAPPSLRVPLSSLSPLTCSLSLSLSLALTLSFTHSVSLSLCLSLSLYLPISLSLSPSPSAPALHCPERQRRRRSLRSDHAT